MPFRSVVAFLFASAAWAQSPPYNPPPVPTTASLNSPIYNAMAQMSPADQAEGQRLAQLASEAAANLLAFQNKMAANYVLTPACHLCAIAQFTFTLDYRYVMASVFQTEVVRR